MDRPTPAWQCQNIPTAVHEGRESRRRGSRLPREATRKLPRILRGIERNDPRVRLLDVTSDASRIRSRGSLLAGISGELADALVAGGAAPRVERMTWVRPPAPTADPGRGQHPHVRPPVDVAPVRPILDEAVQVGGRRRCAEALVLWRPHRRRSLGVPVLPLRGAHRRANPARRVALRPALRTVGGVAGGGPRLARWPGENHARLRARPRCIERKGERSAVPCNASASWPSRAARGTGRRSPTRGRIAALVPGRAARTPLPGLSRAMAVAPQR